MGGSFILLVLCFVITAFSVSTGPVSDCDVLVLGGSTASLAAAVTAARASPTLQICLTDPTDWVGGQLTASAVSAIDFGRENDPQSFGANLPQMFLKISNLFSEATGKCWVSVRCYEPQVLVEWFEENLLRPLGLYNLRVFKNTVVSKVSQVNKNDKRIDSVTCVMRTPQSGFSGWDYPPSYVMQDWYSPQDSDMFTKSIFVFTNLTGKPVIDATEFGDVIALTGTAVQGVEQPEELSTTYYDTCGQSFTSDFYMTASEGIVACPFEPKDKGTCEGNPCNMSLDNFTAEQIWTYRRVKAAADALGAGDVSLQNFDPQDEPKYLFLPLSNVVFDGDWAGGIDYDALRAGESRSYAYFWFFRDQLKKSFPNMTFCMSNVQSGTNYGLSKMPYLRDSRRSKRGIGGFRLSKQMLAAATQFPDNIGIGIYPVDHHNAACKFAFPNYTHNATIQPYYIPFRALTVNDIPNLMVAGKTMAMTWLANAPTRLHPEEWVTGEAAGTAASLWFRNNWRSTSDALSNVGKIQQELLAIGHPLKWTLRK